MGAVMSTESGRDLTPSMRDSPVRGTVLLVDDDLEITRTFARWLALEGYAVRTAADGEAGLREISGADAVILEARMPLLDGLGFLRRARASHAHVPVAIVTGDYLIDQAMLSEFRALGARVLFKPLWVDDLVSLATQLLAQASRA